MCYGVPECSMCRIRALACNRLNKLTVQKLRILLSLELSADIRKRLRRLIICEVLCCRLLANYERTLGLLQSNLKRTLLVSLRITQIILYVNSTKEKICRGAYSALGLVVRSADLNEHVIWRRAAVGKSSTKR